MMQRICKALALGGAAAALAVGGVAAVPASAAPVSSASASVITPKAGACETWHDSNTWGIACGGYPGRSYRAHAWCTNGKQAYGAWKSGTSWVKSYAYCSSVGGHLSSAKVEWK
ncbi:hypothetical protein ACIBCO_33805 [Streptomyces violascens]|uniref:hypothetical protein n=1 Tax=Streptomyces violascens TaxID=67381 RepID=UPI0037885995